MATDPPVFCPSHKPAPPPTPEEALVMIYDVLFKRMDPHGELRWAFDPFEGRDEEMIEDIADILHRAFQSQNPTGPRRRPGFRGAN